MSNLPKLLILGHARHGKDTLAEIYRDRFGYKFESSSAAAARIFIYDELKDKYAYKTPEECFEDRVNHRPEWHQMICDFNKDNQARLASEILKEADCYVGMRDTDEINECMRQGLFDLIIWVDASERKPLEAGNSFNIDKSIAHFIIDNNDTLEAFEDKAIAIGKVIFRMEPMMRIDEINKTGGFLVYCKEKILDGMKEDEIDTDNFDSPLYEMFDNMYVHGWPEVEDEDGGKESLDLENHEILSINDHGMTIIAGGDWQDPHKVQIVFDGDKVHVVSCEKCSYESGIDYDKVFNILGFDMQH